MYQVNILDLEAQAVIVRFYFYSIPWVGGYGRHETINSIEDRVGVGLVLDLDI